MRISRRLDALGSYAFDELDRLAARRREEGADVIDFGVGDPTEATPEVIVEALASGARKHARSGYPPYRGTLGFREAAVDFLRRRHGVALDPERQVVATVGSKEAVFHLPQAFVDPGQVVLVPTPGYPPYRTGTRFADGRAVNYPVSLEGPPLPDLDALPAEVSDALAVVWITQPHVPSGRSASLEELNRLAEQCRARGVLLCSDEAYSELWYDAPPASALEAGTDHVLVFQSLSKRSAMTGYRVGFVAGDARAVEAFGRLKTNIDSGTPWFVQDAAEVALRDEEGPARSREIYGRRAALLLPPLRALGCEVSMPSAGLYLWAATPSGSGVDFARRLLAEDPCLAVMPGEWLADPVEGGGAGPGDGFLRLALVPSTERCREAAQRLAAWAP